MSPADRLDHLLSVARAVEPSTPDAVRDRVLSSVLSAPATATATAAPVMVAPRRVRRALVVGGGFALAAAAAIGIALWTGANEGRSAQSPPGPGSHLGGPDVAAGSGSPIAEPIDAGEAVSVPGGSVSPPAPIPPPSPRPPVVGRASEVEPPSALEQRRITGDRNILPDQATREAIARAGVTRLAIPLKLCIDAAGVPELVTILRASQFPDYDAKIVAVARTWRYRPLVIDGKAQPVCSVVQFLYSQS